jgi:hypothetical protein
VRHRASLQVKRSQCDTGFEKLHAAAYSGRTIPPSRRPTINPHLLDDALWKAWPDPWKPRVSPPQGTKPDADAVLRRAGVGASHRHALAAQLSGITAEQSAADGQKFPGRESGFGGVASFTE